MFETNTSKPYRKKHHDTSRTTSDIRQQTKSTLMAEDSVFSKFQSNSKTKLGKNNIFEELKLSNIFLKEMTDIKELLADTQDRADQQEAEKNML